VTVLLQQLVNGLSQGAIYALIALGYTMVYGTLQLINFAHGEVYMIGAFTGLYLAKALGVVDEPSIVGALLVGVGTATVCAALGVAIERVAYRPMRKSTRLNMLITAIGVSLLLQNLGLLAFGSIDSFPALLPHAQWTVGGVIIRSHDLVVLGTTGEAATLTATERTTVVRLAVKVA
jgi:branched-chain amino acid transport system permease protein